MKFLRKPTSIITSVVLASVVVLTGTTTVLAAEKGTLTITESKKSNTSNEDSVAKEDNTEVTEVENASEESTEEAERGFFPNDFLYFVKSMQEQIQLNLTLDDLKKSQLLAEFAAARIAEANELIQEGKFDEAGELLQLALTYQEEAEATLENGNTEEESIVEGTTGDSNQEDTTDTEDVVQDETEKEKTNHDKDEGTVKVKLANNINALSMVLAKIENPKAQAAIMKNIEKSFGKLAEKIEKKSAKAKEEEETAEEETAEEETNKETVSQETSSVKAPKNPEELEIIVNDEFEKLIKGKNIEVQKSFDNAEKQAKKAVGKAEKKAKKALEKAEKKAKHFKDKIGNEFKNGDKGNK